MGSAKLTPEQSATLDLVIALFRDVGPVLVTQEKLRAFLALTDCLPETPAGRLRWLANRLANARFVDGWKGLRSIYEAAAGLDPADFRVVHSWGITASEWSADSWSTPDLNERHELADEAESALRRALALTTGDARVAYTFGLLFYQRPEGADGRSSKIAEALAWFARAVEWDPHHVMSQLYLAHCYHDLQDWRQAILAYEKVDLAWLAREMPAWRAVKCREQIAHCHACAGNSDRAIQLFQQWIDDVESWDNRAIDVGVINLDELVDAVTNHLDHPALLARTRNLVHRIASCGERRWLEKRYQTLFPSSLNDTPDSGINASKEL